MNDFVCNVNVKPWNIDMLPQKMTYYKKHFNKFKFVLEFDDDVKYSYFLRVLSIIKNNNIPFEDCSFYIDSRQGLFSLQTYKKIKKFYNAIRTLNIPLNFVEHNMNWSMTQVQNTYKQIIKVVNKLKSSQLSPFEQILCAYKEITSRVYTEETKGENALISRSIYGICNSEKIVCTGYAEWNTEVFKMLNNPNIKCFSCSVDIIKELNKQEKSGHRTNMIYIKDDKYGINGLYAYDSCWDSKENENAVMSLKNCLVPIDDLKFYSLTTIVANETNPFIYLINDTKPTNILSVINKNVRDILNKQELIDVQKSREQFKQVILDKYKKYAIKFNEQDYENLVLKLNGKESFNGEVLEYTFLKSVCNKIKEQSYPIKYENFVDGLTYVCKNVYNMSDSQTNEYVKKVIEKSKTNAFDYYTVGAKNCFSVVAKAEHDRSKARAKEILERREKEKLKRQKKLNDLKNKENNQGMEL